MTHSSNKVSRKSIFHRLRKCRDFMMVKQIPNIGLDRNPYAVLNEKIERISELLRFCIMLSAPGALLPPFILSAVNYFVYDLDDESFYLTYSSWYVRLRPLFSFKSFYDGFFFYLPRFPFNWKTPFGYLFAFSSQCLEAITTISSLLPMMCFLAGSCWLLVYFIEDITNDLSRFNLKSEKKANARKKNEQFCNIMKLHGNLKRLR